MPPLYSAEWFAHNLVFMTHLFSPRFTAYGLMAIAVAVYANSFLGAFQFDDFSTILHNPHLDSGEVFFAHLDHMVRPALYFTFLIDRLLYADVAFGYHVINVGLHLVSGWLVYRILLRAPVHENTFLACWTATLFLVHPLATETVTYLSGRASGMMSCFYLLAFLLYLKGTEEGSGGHPRVWYIGSLLAFLVALASKETAVTFPVAILLWDVVVRHVRGASLRSTFLSYHVPFWGIVLALGLALVIHPQYGYLARFSLDIRPLWHNVLSQIHAVVYAIVLFFAPWKQSFDHDLPLYHSLFEWPLVVDLTVLIGLMVAALLSVRRFPLAVFGMGWFFLQLLPTNSVIPRNDLLSERNLYLPSVGLLLAVVTGVLAVVRMNGDTSLRQWMQTGIRCVALMGVMALCVFTVQRNALYQDPVLLWSDTVHKSPHKARPHNNLGHSYAVQGDWGHAIEEFRFALTLNPDYPLAQQNLRDAYLFQAGRSD